MANRCLLAGLLGLSCLSNNAFGAYYQTLVGPALNSFSENVLNSAFVRNNAKTALAGMLMGGGLYAGHRVYKAINNRIQRGRLFFTLGLFSKGRTGSASIAFKKAGITPDSYSLQLGVIEVAENTDLTFKKLIEKLMGEYPVYVRLLSGSNFFTNTIAPVSVKREKHGTLKEVSIDKELKKYAKKRIQITFSVIPINIFGKAIFPEIEKIVITITEPTP